MGPVVDDATAITRHLARQQPILATLIVVLILVFGFLGWVVTESLDFARGDVLPIMRDLNLVVERNTMIMGQSNEVIREHNRLSGHSHPTEGGGAR